MIQQVFIKYLLFKLPVAEFSFLSCCTPSLSRSQPLHYDDQFSIYINYVFSLTGLHTAHFFFLVLNIHEQLISIPLKLTSSGKKQKQKQLVLFLSAHLHSEEPSQSDKFIILLKFIHFMHWSLCVLHVAAGLRISLSWQQILDIYKLKNCLVSVQN